MPYTATTFNSGTAPGIDAPVLNTMQTQYSEATLSLEQDLLTPFVLSGLVATKDGTTASQLDITSGVAFVLQADSTLRRRAPTSSTQSCSGHASTTLYLDLNPDGTWSFGTSHSGVSGYLPIAQVTTDASANILTVTDERTLNTTLLGGAAGVVSIASAQYVNKTGDTMTGALTAPAFHGPADSANSVAAANIGTGALPEGVDANYHAAGSGGTGFVIRENGSTSRGFVLGRNGTDGNGTDNQCIAVPSGGIGFKTGGLSGTALAEFRPNGNMVIGGTTYYTTQSSAGYSCCSSFDVFDLAELFPLADDYPDGTVVCPGDDDRLHRCEHEGCPYALIVSLVPAFCAGGEPDPAAHLWPVALAGRKLVPAHEIIKRRQFVISDGNGGVRAMRPGEDGYALGYALADGCGEHCPLMIRPGYVRVPCEHRHERMFTHCGHERAVSAGHLHAAHADPATPAQSAPAIAAKPPKPPKPPKRSRKSTRTAP